MCGFVGLVDPYETDAKKLVATGCQRLANRGPDDYGIWSEDAVTIAHRRLAVVDLSQSGHQPMVSHDGRFIIAYNGELYNFSEIRSRLIGVKWCGTSDTEVLLAAIVEWGLQKAVSQFVGMFAFALYDRYTKDLYLVRDRLGIKPLYYTINQSILAFASEVSALEVFPQFESSVDRDVLATYFRYGYVLGDRSIYGNVRRLRPGHIACFKNVSERCTSEPVVTAYWSLKDVPTNTDITSSEAEDELLCQLRKAVSSRMLADVPVGAFLSGGIDSSLVCALMQEASDRPIKTFSIGFDDERHNEAPYAKSIAAHLNTQHTELYVTDSEMLEAVARIPSICDEPFADASAIPTYLVSELARNDVTVVLSGDGGDELFWGYERYRTAEHYWRILEQLPKSLKGLIANIATASPVQYLARHIDAPGIFGRGAKMNFRLDALVETLRLSSNDELYLRLLTHWKRPSDLVYESTDIRSVYDDATHWTGSLPFWKRICTRDMHAYLPDDILYKLDRCSMAVSLEARVPILDHRVVEFAYSLPEELVKSPNESKILLKKLLRKYVPNDLTQRPKKGFGVPLAEWLRGPLREWMLDHLNPRTLQSQGFLNPDIVARCVESHLSEARDSSAYLWDVLMFQVWLARTGEYRRESKVQLGTGRTDASATVISAV